VFERYAGSGGILLYKTNASKEKSHNGHVRKYNKKKKLVEYI
jgi:hypothetical protein